MERKLYIVPALISIGVHGICFLSSPERPPFPPETRTGQAPVTTLCINDIVQPPEIPESTDELLIVNNQARLGEPLPGLEEILRDAGPRDFLVDVPPQTANHTLDTLRIGPPGVPDGVIDGELLAKVTPTAIDCKLLDKAPTARMQARPSYPHTARTEGRTGQVLVDFIVNERGEVVRVNILSSSDSIFEEPTRNAVYRWRFAPGTKDGKAVAFKMRVPVTFQIDA